MNKVLFLTILCCFYRITFCVLEDIHRAALAGDVGQVEHLLDEGVNVDARDDEGRTPLELAASAGRYDVAQLLLHKKADVDSRNNNRQTPLHVASQWGRDNIVRLFLKYKAAVGAQDMLGETPLHLAATDSIAQELVRHGAPLNITDYRKRIPLHDASYRGRMEVVKSLVELGADLQATDLDGKKPIDLAGLGTKDKEKQDKIRAYLKKEEMLAEKLQKAAREGDEVTIEKEILAGAPINSPDKDGNTPLHLAVKSENPKAVECLLKFKDKINFNMRNLQGRTAIEEAAYHPIVLPPFKKILKEKINNTKQNQKTRESA